MYCAVDVGEIARNSCPEIKCVKDGDAVGWGGDGRDIRLRSNCE